MAERHHSSPPIHVSGGSRLAQVKVECISLFTALAAAGTCYIIGGSGGMNHTSYKEQAMLPNVSGRHIVALGDVSIVVLSIHLISE